MFKFLEGGDKPFIEPAGFDMDDPDIKAFFGEIENTPPTNPNDPDEIKDIQSTIPTHQTHQIEVPPIFTQAKRPSIMNPLPSSLKQSQILPLPSALPERVKGLTIKTNKTRDINEYVNHLRQSLKIIEDKIERGDIIDPIDNVNYDYADLDEAFVEREPLLSLQPEIDSLRKKSLKIKNKTKSVRFENQADTIEFIEKSAKEFMDAMSGDDETQKVQKIIDLINTTHIDNNNLDEDTKIKMYCVLYQSFIEDGMTKENAFELLETVKDATVNKKKIKWSRIINKINLSYGTLLKIWFITFLMTLFPFVASKVWNNITDVINTIVTTLHLNTFIDQLRILAYPAIIVTRSTLGNIMLTLNKITIGALDYVAAQLLKPLTILLVDMPGAIDNNVDTALWYMQQYVGYLFIASLAFTGAIIILKLLVSLNNMFKSRDGVCENMDQETINKIKNIVKETIKK